MKRVSKALTALLLALVMTVTLLPVQVLAAESGTEERTFTGTYVNPAYAGRIAGTVQARTAVAAVAAEPKNAETVYTSVAEAAAALRRQMTARSNSMTVALYADSSDWKAVALSVWNAALDHVAGSGNTGDYLHWQYAGVSYSASYRASGTGYQYSLTYTPNPEAASTIWYTTAAQEQQLDGYIRGTILPQLALDGKTAYQKVQAIYGWITKNVSYDHDNLHDNSYLLKYTAYAAAINRTAVCQGYANLFYRLANDAGLDCRIITGVANGGSGAEAHAWNIVRMEDGKYYCVDATWDAGRSSYRYFLKGLDAFRADHTAMTDEKNSTYWTEYVGKVSATDYVPGSTTVVETPANVTMKSAAVSGSSIVVTWEAAEGAKTYTIYRKAAGETGWRIIAKSVSGTSYTDKSVTAGIPYTYTVRGVAADGKTMSAGYDGTGVTATVPAAGVLASGNCGPSGTDDSSITWKLTSDGVLTFTGKGSLQDYYTPWLRDDLIGHIKKVVIGSGITYVGSNLFYDCSNLTELTLPNTVQAIGIEAFSCTRLRDVVIPDSVTTIHDGAFRYCYEMETLSLGSGVTSIGPAAFERSTAKVTLSSKNTAFSLQDNVLFDRNKTTLVQCFNGDVATYTVPSTVKELGDYSFAGLDRLETVIIPNGVTRLGEGAFETCKELVKVDIPASVTEIGSEAFAFSSNARVSVAAGNTAYCSRNGALFTKNMDTLLHSGAATGHYTVPNGVVSIENGAFAEAAITGITFPSSLKYVGRIAFFGCTELTSLTIPSTVQALDGQAFAYCEKLTSVTIENGLQTLPYLVFQECRALETVVIPKSVTVIHGKAFLNCSALKTVVYGGTKAEWDKIEIGDGNEALTKAALRCTGVTTAVPANVTMKSAAVSGSSIVVTWEAAEGAKTYIIYRKTKNTNWTVLVSGVSGTSYTDKSVTAGETYTYTVRGVAADGRTMSKGYDGTGKTATVPAVPANVTMKSAAVSGSSIVVTWEAAANAKTYIIYRKTKNTNWTVLVSGVSGTSYTDKSVAAGETYTYTVRGVAADGRTMSKGYDGTGKTATVPAVPANVTMKSAAVSGSSIVVTWEAAANAKTYTIYRKTKNTNWTVLVSGVSGTSYTDKSVTAGETYTYTVRGVAADGRTMSKGYDGTGKTATVPKPDSGVPANVTMKSAAVSGTSIVVTWEAAANAKTYTIYRKTKNTNWTVLVSGVSGTSYTDKSVTAGETYTYTVRGVAADGRTMSKGYDGTGKTATVPAVPANVTMKSAAVSGSSIVVTWEAAANAKTYTIYRKTKNTNWTVLVNGVSGTSYTDKSVTAGETYTYTVRGVAADGRTMSKGYDGTGKTATMPKPDSGVPANVTMKSAAVSGTSIVVTWEAAANAKTYTIYRKTKNTNWTVLLSGVSGTSYTDKSVTAGETYTYTVRGVAADGRTMSKGYDGTGKTATVPKPDSGVPANVTMKSAAVSGTSIVVTWEAAANAKTYTIYRKTKSTNWTVLVSGVSGTSYTDKSVTAGEPYTYTVRGVASDGRTMSKGYDGTGKTATVPKPDSGVPANVTMKSAAVSGTSIVVTWEAAANAKTYTIYRKTKSTNWTVLVSGVSGTSYTDKSVAAGETYTYTVRGVAADGKTMSKGYDGTGKTAKVPDASAVPDPVTMVGAVADSTGITVTWKTAMGAAAYTIYRKTAGTNWTVLVSGVKGTSYVDNTALAKGTYTYTVRGVAADGRTMSPSYDRTGKTATMPETVVPANVKLGKAIADAAGITVTWEAAANAKTYAIYRKTGSTSWTLLTTKASGTSYKDLTAARNQLYTYTVRGVAADGRTMSAGYDHTGVSARITASASTRPDRVKLKAAERLSDGILVTWKAAANARTYVVYRSKVVSGQASGWTAIARDVTNTYYKDIGGVSGTQYAYTVIGVAADGRTTSPSYHTYGVRATMP